MGEYEMSKPSDRCIEQGNATERPGSVYPLAASALGGLIAGLIAFVVTLRPVPQAAPAIPPPPVAATNPLENMARRDVMRARFFDAEVEPRIVETDALNREAAQRCVERLGHLIDHYRDGVDPFVEDLTSISTRLGIVRRMPGNWWKGDKRIEGYVQQKFEKHLFSQQTLMRGVAGVLDDFRGEIDANQKRMLVSVQASLNTADLPEVDIEDYQPFFASVANQLQTYSAEQGTTSVYNGLTVLAVSEVGSFAAVSVVSGLLARFGSAAAATAAVGVGATAGTTAAGASGGSLVGPVGTVVGLGVGLAVGLSIDWWMTEQFEEKMNQQMKGYLDSLEQTLLHGSIGSIQNITHVGLSTPAGGGIAEALPVVCDRLLIAYRERFYEQIVTQASP
jgi:hypothetical protein